MVRKYGVTAMRTIEIDITEGDIELFKDVVYDGEIIEWSFEEINTGEEIKVRFIPYRGDDDA